MKELGGAADFEGLVAAISAMVDRIARDAEVGPENVAEGCLAAGEASKSSAQPANAFLKRSE